MSRTFCTAVLCVAFCVSVLSVARAEDKPGGGAPMGARGGMPGGAAQTGPAMPMGGMGGMPGGSAQIGPMTPPGAMGGPGMLAPVSQAPAKPKETKALPSIKPKAPPPAPAKRRIGEAAIEKTLDEPTSVEFVETPLVDVLEYLKDHHRVEIQLDHKAISDVGIGADTPVTANLKDISLRSALRLLLRPLNLTWTIDNEVLLITTPEESEKNLITKVIDVSDLVVCRDKHDELWDDYDTLIDAITSSVMPTTWDCVGGPGSVCGASLGKAKVLIIGQVYECHREVERLLNRIREIAKRNPDDDVPQRDPPTSERQRPKARDFGGIGTPMLPGMNPSQRPGDANNHPKADSNRKPKPGELPRGGQHR